MLTDKELDALLMLLRNGGTQLSRLNLAECRQVFRFAESQGYTIGLPGAVAAAQTRDVLAEAGIT